MAGVAERTAPAPNPVRRPRRSVGSLVQGVAIALGFVMLLGGFGFIAAQYRPYRIPTDSMSPTVESGDTVLARSVSGGSVGRGDIVIFHEPLWGGDAMVKRVIGVGGDTVAMDNLQHLTVNGTPITEPYLAEQSATSVAFSIKVPDGRLFLLGDHRDSSLDSRSHLDVAAGTIATSDVTARVAGTVWPFDRLGVHKRTVAFSGLAGTPASDAGLLGPAAFAMVSGAALILLASLVGGLVSLGRRIRRG